MRGTVVKASADTVTQGLGMTSLPVTTSPMIIYISKVPDFLVFSTSGSHFISLIDSFSV